MLLTKSTLPKYNMPPRSISQASMRTYESSNLDILSDQKKLDALKQTEASESKLRRPFSSTVHRSPPSQKKMTGELSYAQARILGKTSNQRPQTASLARKENVPIARAQKLTVNSLKKELGITRKENTLKTTDKNDKIEKSDKSSESQSQIQSQRSDKGALTLLNEKFVDDQYFPSKNSNEGDGRKWKLSDFVVGEPLGKGKFGVVYTAFEKKSKKVVALKILDKQKMKLNRCASLIKREIMIQSQLNHPNILRMYGYFTDATKVYLILEHCPKGEVYRVLRRSKRFSEKTSARFVENVAKALEYCHERHIIHRDIKPENLLISEEGTLKLCDFGWSIQTEKGERRSTMCGTLDYLAPEMVEKKPHDAKLDLWCLGILTFEFLCGRAPFHSTTNQETIRKISKAEVKFPSYVSDDAKDFIQQLLKRSRNDRLSLQKVFVHPFITKYSKSNPSTELANPQLHPINSLDSEKISNSEEYKSASEIPSSNAASTVTSLISSLDPDQTIPESEIQSSRSSKQSLDSFNPESLESFHDLPTGKLRRIQSDYLDLKSGITLENVQSNSLVSEIDAKLASPATDIRRALRAQISKVV